jgi:hypothetical protein
VNWLNVVGRRWLEGSLETADFEDRSGLLRTTRASHGVVLVQAGGNPILGDHNRFQDITAYALVSKLLEPALIKEPTGLAGMFHDHGSTLAWIRRFVEPQQWHDHA